MRWLRRPLTTHPRWRPPRTGARRSGVDRRRSADRRRHRRCSRVLAVSLDGITVRSFARRFRSRSPLDFGSSTAIVRHFARRHARRVPDRRRWAAAQPSVGRSQELRDCRNRRCLESLLLSRRQRGSRFFVGAGAEEGVVCWRRGGHHRDVAEQCRVRRGTGAPPGQTTARLPLRRRPAPAFSVFQRSGRRAEAADHHRPDRQRGGPPLAAFHARRQGHPLHREIHQPAIVRRRADHGPVAGYRRAASSGAGRLRAVSADRAPGLRARAEPCTPCGSMRRGSPSPAHPSRSLTRSSRIPRAEGRRSRSPGPERWSMPLAAPGPPSVRLLWVDRSGAARPVTDRQASFWWPRISPDGRRIAVVIDAAFSKIWVLDVERGTFTRASQLAGDQDRAAWMPDGVHVTFGADTAGSGAIRLFSDRIDGTGSATLLFDGSESRLAAQLVAGWTAAALPADRRDHRSGRVGLLRRRSDVDAVPPELVERDCRPPSRRTAAGSRTCPTNRAGPRCTCDRSPGPAPGARFRSTAARLQCGRETGASCSSRKATRFSRRPSASAKRSPAARCGVCSRDRTASTRSPVNYDVAPDGQHFLVPRSQVDSAPRQLELVLNWFEDLNRLAPR